VSVGVSASVSVGVGVSVSVSAGASVRVKCAASGPVNLHFSLLPAEVVEVPWNQCKCSFFGCRDPAKCWLKWCGAPRKGSLGRLRFFETKTVKLTLSRVSGTVKLTK
jgi:hypothetical protein